MTQPQDMPQSTPERPIVTTVFKGREVTLRLVNDVQLALIKRNLGMIRHGADPLTVLDAMSRVLDILQSMFINPEDSNWLVELMYAGQIESGDMLPLLNAFSVTGNPEPVVKKPRKARAGRSQ